MSEPAPDPQPTLSASIGSFAGLVAAGTPTPGGGSVAAYSGMLAASLGQMVCNITIGKKKYAGIEPRMRAIRSELHRLSVRLRELIAEDAESFDGVLKAYQLPKETPVEQVERDAQIQTALQRAVDVPFQTAHRSFEVVKLLGELAEIGNPNALSDVAVGAQLAQVGVRGGAYNVAANLSSITDREAAVELGAQMRNVVEQASKIAEAVEAKMKL